MSTSRTREKADGELFKSTGIDDNATSTAITIDSNENVTIGADDQLNMSGSHNEGGALINLKGTDTPAAGKNLGALNFGNSTDASLAMIRGLSTASDAADMLFFTEPSGGSIEERMRIDSGGNVTVNNGNLVIGTNGKGIDFSANADSSATGASTTSELLDDYEEGTWTGTLTGATASPSTPQTATGSYTKVGRLCTVSIAIDNKNTSGASGGLKVTGLPFTSSINAFGSYISYGVADYTANAINTVSWCGSGSAYIDFYDNTDSGVWSTTQIVAGSLKYLYLSLTYQTS